MGNMMNGEEINVSNRKLKTKGYERFKDFCVSGLQKVVINKASCASDWEIEWPDQLSTKRKGKCKSAYL